MTGKYQYTIEGEKLTMIEIIRKIPEIQADTLRLRINRGVRTWEGLREDPKAARKKLLDRQRRKIAPLFTPKG